MKNLRALLFLFLSTILFSCNNSVEPADLVIKNAKVTTIDPDYPSANAIAFVGEEILYVGSDDEVKKYISAETKVIDANGRLVIPGFNDAHAHFRQVNPDYVELRYITDPNIITQKVAEAVAKVDPGVLIKGGHWEHEMFTTREWPTKELIDKVSPNNPVVLSRTDGHSTLVNSYVLKYSGITKDTPNPFGGEIQKDPVTGEPTGILKESAEFMIKYPEVKSALSAEEQYAKDDLAWKIAFEKAAKYGVTSIQLPGDGWDEAETYQKYLDEGSLSLRIDISAMLTDNPDTLQMYAELQEEYPQEDNWIRFGYLKDYMDGTLGSATMMVFEPFEDAPHATGLPQMTYERLVEKIRKADEMGFQVGIHAIGPKANQWVLNAYEEVRLESFNHDPRHRIEHAQILAQNEIPRFAELGVIASMQPTHCITDKRFCEKRIGKDRSKGAYAWRSLLEANAKIAFGTDYSVEPLNPMEGLYAAVTRKDRLGEEGDGWFPEQKLTMLEAIELYTMGAAYAQFMEERKGMIKKGFLGDVVVLDQDLFSIPEEEIMKTKVDITIVGGKVVYERN